MSDFLRCLIDPPLDGPANMARDEALLAAVADAKARPTLRFYRWEPPTISLGYFQNFEDFQALDSPAGDLPVVRRLTGGGAILHAAELTYCLTLPANHPFIVHNPDDLYVRFHDAVIAALVPLGLEARRCGKTRRTHPRPGPFFCFQRRYGLDVLVDTRKIAGSAQRRTKKAILQHGSIILDDPFAQQPSFGGITPDESVIAQLIEKIKSNLNIPIEPGRWSPAELSAAQKLRPKYLDPAWTRRR